MFRVCEKSLGLLQGKKKDEVTEAKETSGKHVSPPTMRKSVVVQIAVAWRRKMIDEVTRTLAIHSTYIQSHCKALT